MRIRVWGCRGSLATPGETTIRYGGNTTCVEVELESGAVVLFDAGSGIRNLGKHILKHGPRELYLFMTHSHWDHLNGFPFFLPAYSNQYTIHVRGGPRAKKSLQKFISHQMEPPYFPVPFGAMHAQFDFTQGSPSRRSIGHAEILPVPISHPNGGYGFKVMEEGKTFVFLPDNELDFQQEDGLVAGGYADFCRGADVLFHDAQYTDEEYASKKGWGHSRLSSVMDLGVSAGVKQLGLFHHDPDRSDDDLDRLGERCAREVRARTERTSCFPVREGMELVI